VSGPAPAAVFPHFSTDKIQRRGFLYLATSLGVQVYTKGGYHQPLLGIIHTGNQAPTGLYVPKNGDLYVANGYADDILVFHRNATSPYRVLTGSGGVIGRVTVDIFGNVYATETLPKGSNSVYSFSGGVIDVFSGGSNTPTATLTDVPKADYLATDSHGDLFVQTFSDTASKVFEYRVGHAKPVELPIPGYTAGGISLNERDQLFVGDGGGEDGFSGSLSVYDPPYQHRAIRTTGFDGGVHDLFADRSEGDIWVATYGIVGKAYLLGPLFDVHNVLLPSGKSYVDAVAADWL